MQHRPRPGPARSGAGALVVAVALLACIPADGRPAPANLARKYKLSEPTGLRPVTEKAIALANGVLHSSLRLRLGPAWRTPSADVVPVYVVSGPSIAATELAFRPPRERCIFVAASASAEIKKRFTGHDKAGMEYQPEEPLALILLHELGHLHYGDTGYEKDFVPFELEDLQRPPSRVKNPEIRADLFAVSQIRNAIKPGNPQHRFEAGLPLNLFLPKVAWNLQTRRSLDDGNFGGTALALPRLFQDAGGTHPNFELRSLVMACALHDSKPARDLLQAFLQHRAKAAQKRSGTSSAPR